MAKSTDSKEPGSLDANHCSTLKSCVIFGKSFKTSVLQFPHLLMRIIMWLRRCNEGIIYKMLKIMSGNRAIYIYVCIYMFANAII